MINAVKKIIKRFVYLANIYRYVRLWLLQRIYKKNIFNDKFTKKVLLLTYSSSVMFFGFKANYGDTATPELFLIAEIFRDKKFLVDIVYQDCCLNINFNEYEIIVGGGEIFKKVLLNKFNSSFKIYFAAGRYTTFNNNQTISRLIDFASKHGEYLLESCRLDVDGASLLLPHLANMVMAIGNEDATYTYTKNGIKNVFKLPMFYYELHNSINIYNSKNYSSAKSNFLFIGGSGLIHKGLDLLLDVFCKHKELILHICANFSGEKKFENIYKNVLYGSSNIKTYGFVDISSDLFKRILTDCAYVVFPSCSESQPAGVINAMGNGCVIPVVSSFCSIDVKDFGINIEKLDFDSVEKAVLFAANKTSDHVKINSLKVINEMKQLHTMFNYKESASSAIESIMKQYD